MDPLITGGLISGAGSLLGSLFGGSQHDSAGDQLQSLINTAKKNGINPLAVLGSNLGTAYGPASTVGDAIGDAAGAIGNAVANSSRNSLEQQLLQAQIATQKAQAADLLSSATSRTALTKMRAASTSGPLTGPNVDAPGFKRVAGQRVPFGMNSRYADTAAREGMLRAEMDQWLNFLDEAYRLQFLPWWREFTGLPRNAVGAEMDYRGPLTGW